MIKGMSRREREGEDWKDETSREQEKCRKQSGRENVKETERREMIEEMNGREREGSVY